ncbi:hypothetical protein Tsubulata_040016 [Turnera subulata]|uniref:Endonuclease/exonuclease/phosphatase domain-containing protein n=1 Tax=Turnera subulata TaxID=218843 RepID=A0A9Q0JMI3_9ROSI|nr:hypothetical protein Tsubulata_040016 [Turnera subulata]
MDESLDVSVIFTHPQFIHAKVTTSSESFFITAVYGSPQEKWRRYLWRNLEALALVTTGPWLILGDFNAVLTGSERLNKQGRDGVANSQFLHCVNEAKLINLGFSGPKYTWKRGGDSARLDRMLGNLQWLD